MAEEEYVVLVDKQDNQVGTALKSKVHTNTTPLHRAFSVFVFNKTGQLLVTQRAMTKKTWPGIWSNSFCGHPGPEETRETAIYRRAHEELGISLVNLVKVADYTYRFELDGVVENEVCPVYRAQIQGEMVHSNPSEIADWKWMKWSVFTKTLQTDTQGRWSPWCKEEVAFFS